MNVDRVLSEKPNIPSGVDISWFSVLRTDWVFSDSCLRRLYLDNHGNYYLHYMMEVLGELHEWYVWCRPSENEEWGEEVSVEFGRYDVQAMEVFKRTEWEMVNHGRN